MKRALAVVCIVVSGALLGACGKGGSGNPTAASDAAASGASGQAASAATVAAAPATQAPGTVGTMTKTQLPAEATDTLRLIKSGGPFPSADDGVLFRNSASLLPKHARGYYHLYTVRTPGATDSGKRRIVCGGARRQTSECYYTEDYYASFRRIAE